jgi:hypothetical protein
MHLYGGLDMSREMPSPEITHLFLGHPQPQLCAAFGGASRGLNTARQGPRMDLCSIEMGMEMASASYARFPSLRRQASASDQFFPPS